MSAGVVSDDLIAEILTKLPVKSLLRFKCVCKIWYAIISDPQFSNNSHRVRPSLLISQNLREFSALTIESLLTKDRAPTPLSLPWQTERGDCYSYNICLGSSNGLVCVDHKNSSSHYRSSLILWNPSTRKFKRLPSPRSYSTWMRYDGWTFAWFGYDELVDDYKLVWLHFSDLSRAPELATLDVFTLKSNTWRRLEVDHISVNNVIFFDNGEMFNSISTGVFSNGEIHWIINYSPLRGADEVCILVLDLATEKLRLLNFSHARLSRTSRLVSLEGGCLCLCNDAYEDGYRGRHLWMMKEYGVDSSWTKLASIPLRFISPHYNSGMVYPILFSKEGEEMVVICKNGGRIVKFRVEEGGEKIKNEETLACVNGRLVHKDLCESNVMLHMESLVSI